MKMNFKVPILKRCCFCLPLRYGLICYGYIKLIIMIVLIIQAVTGIAMFFTHGSRLVDIIPTVVLTVFGVFDVTMTALFLKAAHLKNVKLFKIYYNYYCVFAVVNMLLYLTFVGLHLYFLGMYRISYDDADIWWEFTTLMGPIGFVNFVLLAYTLLLLRSQLLRLQNDYTYRIRVRDNESQETERIADELCK